LAKKPGQMNIPDGRDGSRLHAECACAERFFHGLKVESVYGEHLATGAGILKLTTTASAATVHMGEASHCLQLPKLGNLMSTQYRQDQE